MKRCAKPLLALLAALCLFCPLALSAQAASSEDELMDAITEAAENWETEVDLRPYGLTGPEVGDVWNRFLLSQPRYFYLMRVDLEDWSVLGNTLPLMYSSEYDAGDVSDYEAAVQKALDTAVLPDMSDIEIALALHDYLCSVVEYDHYFTLPDEVAGTPHAALVGGLAVCQGYALAYADLLQRCGIECIMEPSDAMVHAWNLVKLDGEWYHVDVTWDDQEFRILHRYFLCSDADLLADTAPDTHHDWLVIYPCTDTTYDAAEWKDPNQYTSPFAFSEAGASWELAFNGCGFDLVRRNWNTGAKETVKSVDDVWPVDGMPGAYYDGCFGSIIAKDGLLYFNGPETLYCYDPATDMLTSVSIDTEGAGSLYGLFRKGEEICCCVGKDPNAEMADMPVPDAVFDALHIHTHSLTAVSAKAPTCTEVGSIACYVCDLCGKHFSDAAGTAEIADDSWILPALGHSLSGHAYVAPTDEEAGSRAYWSCSECGKFFSDADGTQEIAENSWRIPPLGSVNFGDVNSDGDINGKDSIVLARYNARWSGYDAMIDLAAADVNGDGLVNGKDSIVLARYNARWSGYENLPLVG